MHKDWSETAWEEYVSWQTKDPAVLRKINTLLKEVSRDPFRGIGKPEPLKGDLSGWWSRRIDGKNRLVYRIKNDVLEIAQCGTHYGQK
ncbi:MAG: Txe/YoeB family addiction module toxin [Muribaculaceae bacterium]|nr:Txe/YoeB family addiction module toxin [Muribaculaceae bacterium]